MHKFLIALAAGLALSSAAHAELYTLNYTAIVSKIYEIEDYIHEIPLPNGAIGDYVIKRGDTVSGTFVFETPAPIIDQSEYDGETRITYRNPSFLGSFQFEEAQYKEISATGSSEVTVDDAKSQSGNSDRAFFIGRAYRYGNYWSDFGMLFADQRGQAWNSSAIPTTSLAQTNATFFYTLFPFDFDLPRVHIEGDVTSMSLVSTVPEPSTYAMLLAGLSLLTWRRKRA